MVKCPHASKGCNYPEAQCDGHCLVDNGLRKPAAPMPEALRLADYCDQEDAFEVACSNELRRLHAANHELLEALRYIEGLALADQARDLPTIAQTAGAAIAKAEGKA
jgi:hypothetical protein